MFKNSTILKNTLMIAGVTGIMATSAYAATENVTANIAFDATLTIVKEADIDFGTVLASTADTYTIDTAGAVTAAGSGATVAGSPAPGSGKTLLLGVEAVVDGTQAAGATAAPTFDVVVNYQ